MLLCLTDDNPEPDPTAGDALYRELMDVIETNPGHPEMQRLLQLAQVEPEDGDESLEPPASN